MSSYLRYLTKWFKHYHLIVTCNKQWQCWGNNQLPLLESNIAIARALNLKD